MRLNKAAFRERTADAGALLIITILVRYVPIIPIQETAEELGLEETDKNKRS